MQRLLALGFAALLGLSGSALAGGKNYDPVWVNTTARSAGGSLADARGSADSVQWIGCDVEAYAASLAVPTVAICYARDVKGTMVTCMSSEARLIQVALGLNGDSYLSFNWDKSGQCTMIHVGNQSTFSPKQP
jgi:hypothetical protein